MKNYTKLLVIKCDDYLSKIVKEYNLSSKEEAKAMAKNYLGKDGVACLIIEMGK